MSDLFRQIKETLRFFPVTPWNFPRVVPEGGLTVGGHFFKAGTLASTNPWVLHRNRDIFGPDAEIFNPLRWLDPASKALDQYLITVSMPIELSLLVQIGCVIYNIIFHCWLLKGTIL